MKRPGTLRVTHVARSLSVLDGGVSAVVRQLSEKLAHCGIPVQIVHATGDPGELPAGVEVFTFPPTGLGRVWSWAPGLRESIAQLAAPPGSNQPIFHIHGVWAAPQYIAARAAYSAGVSVVVTAHGALEPWLWDEQGWRIRAKKRAYWAALGYPALRKASVIHAITALEREHLSRLFPGQRIEIIPNAVDLNDFPICDQHERDKTILFLGRIEPKKGVDLLLRAFALAGIGREWSIDVVGPVWSKTYQSGLQAIVGEFGLEQRVRFHGALFGEKKQKLMRAAWVMAVPSHSEVAGLVNLEAAAMCLPTITTLQTGLHDWERGGGMLIEPNVDSLRRALEKACSWSVQEQRQRGAASRHLIEERYCWEVVLPMWIQLYDSLQ